MINRLLLVDDKHEKRFWKNLPEGFWGGVKVTIEITPKHECFASPAEFTVERVAQVVLREAANEDFCVITDAHFGADGNAGRKVLNQACDATERLRFGCVYSIDTGDIQLSSPKRCLVYRRAPGRNVADELREVLVFLETGKRPSRVSEDAYRGLTQTIHALHSMPCQLDVETVREIVQREEKRSRTEGEDCTSAELETQWSGLCTEVCSANFEGVQDGDGERTKLAELVDQALIHVQTEDVQVLLNRERWDLTLTAAKQAINDAAKGLVASPKWSLQDARRLLESLTLASDSIDRLIDYLQGIRKPVDNVRGCELYDEDTGS